MQAAVFLDVRLPGGLYWKGDSNATVLMYLMQ